MLFIKVWDFDKFQSYLTEHEKLPSDWVEKTLKVSNLHEFCPAIENSFPFDVLASNKACDVGFASQCQTQTRTKNRIF